MWAGLSLLAKGASGEENGLVACWSFDEGQSNEIHDASSLGNNGVIKGDPVWVKGISKYALQCGGNSYLEVQHSPALDFHEALTISLWLKIEESEKEGNKCFAIMDKTRGTWKNQAWCLTLDNRREFNSSFFGSLRWDIVTGTGKSWKQAASQDDIIPDAQWHHVAATFDMKWPKLQQRLYLDGIPIAAYPNTEVIQGNKLPLYIGCCNPADKNTDVFLIDEVRLYNRALSQQEINDLYHAFKNKNRSLK